MPRQLRLAALAACALAMTPAWAAGEKSPTWHVTRTVTLGAPEQWDYLVYSPQTHDVYVSHGDRVSVVDGRDGHILGSVDGIKGGPHGFAIVASLARATRPIAARNRRWRSTSRR